MSFAYRVDNACARAASLVLLNLPQKSSSNEVRSCALKLLRGLLAKTGVAPVVVARVRLAAEFKSICGNKAAPTSRSTASASSMRATASLISLLFCTAFATKSFST